MQVMPAAHAVHGTATDEDLIGSAAAGDQKAFGIIFDRHSRVVYGLALTTLRVPADAEDILSETFLTLWRKRDRVTFIHGSVLPWLIVTTRHHTSNRRRAVARDTALSLDDDITTGSSAGADTMAAYNELADQLDRVIRQLGPLEQRVVDLCLVEGLSYEQAARRMGVSHSSVRNRLSRARTELRQQLRPETQPHD
jgi:RNA polymerase sigma factor (sigma-70 family)